MKTKIVTGLCMLTLGSLKAQSLDHYVALALESQPTIQAQAMQIKALERKTDQLSPWQDPVLSAGYNLTPNSMERASASVMQNFSWFGTTKAQQKASKMATQSSAYELINTKSQIKLAVSTLYLEIQELTLQRDLQQEIVKTYTDLEQLVLSKLATSKASMVDVSRAELEKEKAQTQITLLDLQIDNLKQALNRMVLKPATDPVKLVLVQPILLSSETPVDQQPALQAIQAKAQEMELLTQVARKEGAPVIGLGVDYMLMNPTHHEFMPMISVSIPIYRKKYKAKIEETQYLQQAYQMEQKSLEIEHYRSRNQLQSQWSQLQQERLLFEKQVVRLEKAKELLLTYYSTQGAEFEELIRLQQDQDQYKSQLITNSIAGLKLAKQWQYLNQSGN